MIEHSSPPPLDLLDSMMTREERRRGRQYVEAKRKVKVAAGWEPMWESWMHAADREIRAPAPPHRDPFPIQFRDGRGQLVAFTLHLPRRAA